MKGSKQTALPLAALLGLAALAGVQALAQSPAEPQGSLTVTLPQALERAKANNALLQAARADVKAKEGQFKQARSLYWPDLTFTENYSRTNNPVYVFMGKLTQANFTMMDFYIPSLNNPEPLTNWQSRVELTMPLFTSGKVSAANRATKMGVEAAQETSAFAESSVAKGVTQAFYGSLLAHQAVVTMEEAVKTAEAHQAQVEALYKQGLVLDSDLMRIKVFVADVRQQLAQRAADEQVARAYLAYAMGTGEDVVPQGAFDPAAEPLPSLAEAQNAALQSRGDLKAAALQAGQAGEGVKMARADYLPQVGLMASYEQDTQRWTPQAWGDNWMLGVQLRIPLFDGGNRAGQLQTAKAQEFQAQQALLDAQQKVRVEVKAAWLRAQAATERVAVTTESESAARENQRIVALRYQEGMAPVTDLLDADMAVTAAALTRSQAIHDELVERANLAWAMGK
jgi:outer membrane protein